MRVRINPTPLAGRVEAVASKSAAQRHLICAALSESVSELHCRTVSEDVAAAIRCLRALGAGVETRGDSLRVTPIASPPPFPLLDCGESGATLRFLLPVAAALGVRARFTGRGRLPERPLAALLAAMAQNGGTIEGEALPLTVTGPLRPGTYTLPGDVSSQYVSGLLFALPRLEGESRIVLTSPLLSAPYVDLTLAILRQYGVEAEETGAGFRVPGGQGYHAPPVAVVEGDWSSAAFLLAAGALGGPVTVGGLSPDSRQGDRAICSLLRRFGASVKEGGGSVTVAPGPLRGCTADVGQTPDLLPALAVVAACAAGESRFTRAGRLRDKESDRLEAVAALLRALGGWAEVRPDGLTVRGGLLRGGTAEGAGDHRIVMAAALAAAVCREPVTIHGAAAAKSYPGFFDDYRALGGMVDVI